MLLKQWEILIVEHRERLAILVVPSWGFRGNVNAIPG